MDRKRTRRSDQQGVVEQVRWRHLLQSRGVVLSQLVHLSLPNALLFLKHLDDCGLALVQVPAHMLHLVHNKGRRGSGSKGANVKWTSQPAGQ